MNNLDNGKKYALIAGGILVGVLLLILIIERSIHPTSSPSPQNTVPTPYYANGHIVNNPIKGKGQNSSSLVMTPAPTMSAASTQMSQLKQRLPVETDDFIAKYDSSIDRVVVTRKTPGADEAFQSWADQMGYPLLVNNILTTIVTDKSIEELHVPFATQTPEKQLDNIVHIFGLFIQPQFLNTTPNPTPKISPTPIITKSPPLTGNGYVYYPQCDGPYDNYPLATGCNVCQAGCGPTTVAMILSSYVDQQYTPPKVVDIYTDIGAAACGTAIGYAKRVIESKGLTTSSYLFAVDGGVPIENVADDIRSYIKGGWTIFTLASYCDGGCGHYFWITDIDSNNNVMAYDPYYGKNSTPPINENSRYPFPKYVMAFGVKK